LGHMALVSALTAAAAAGGLASLLYTFDDHPQNVLASDRPRLGLLMNKEQKCDILRAAAADAVYFERFDLEYARMEPEEFVSWILVGKLRAKLAVVGFNYRFGHKNRGTPELLRKFGAARGLGVLVVEPYRVGGQCVSSSLIRQKLEAGDVRGAALCLGRLFSVRGAVCEGRHIGRTIGVPTANISRSPGALAPAQGVYVTACKVGGRMYRSVTSIGRNPTVARGPAAGMDPAVDRGPASGMDPGAGAAGMEPAAGAGGSGDATTETFMLGFSGDAYGAEAEVYFYEKLRDIRKFSDLGALKGQIQKDIRAAESYFSGIGGCSGATAGNA
ncbi:MAG: bifunctional riboflavin kinase/FMN adenylyltransferase, partial [Clostridiales bacterium]|nr:bifunctional riboflavin kinase/FMN adenylyltransferase [Clostridiales bacterium]